MREWRTWLDRAGLGRFALLLGCLAVGLVAMAKGGAPSRVSLTSDPPGATVFADGENRGMTPLMLFDLEPGRHHFKFRLAGCADGDVFLTTHEGQVVDHNEVLEEERGLLLLKTDPPGCNIKVNGVSVGETPRFIGNLSVRDTHSVRLSKAGYQDQTISVKFNGREPLVREERMVLDSGVLDVVTDPAGAEVTVNGIGRGKTPVLVRDIPKGTIAVKLVLDGYREETREIRMNAGEQQTLSVSLTGLPGTLHLLSDPTDASFYVNDEARGRAPLSIAGLKPGDYVVRCEREGYATLTRTITIRNGESTREEFKLSNVMGRIEVRSLPVGADVYLDGRKVGVTKGTGGPDGLSDVFPIERVMEGEHQLVLRKDGFQEVSRTVVVESKQTSKQHRVIMKRAFIPNIEIETPNGVFRGVFRSQSESTIVIETKPGTDYPIPRSFVRKIKTL